MSGGLREHFDARLGAMLADALTLIECESPSSDLGALGDCAEVLSGLGQRLVGAAPDQIEADGRRHLRWSWPGDGPRVLLLGHYDTVWPVGSLAALPARIEAGRLRGPGCFDMQVGVIMALYAIGSLADRRGVTLVLTADEEIGAPTSRELIVAEARRAAGALVLEGAGPGGALKIARAGYARYQVAAQGRSAHAGLDPETGINAAIELAHQILAVAALGDPAVATTVTPTLTAAGSSRNTVPGWGTVAVDVRARSGAELERVNAALGALTPVTRATVEVTRQSARPPMARHSSDALFALAQEAAGALGLGGVEGIEVGGVSDGNLTAAAGTPTLDGLGASGGGAHADDEYVDISRIPGSTALVRALMDDTLAGRVAGA